MTKIRNGFIVLFVLAGLLVWTGTVDAPGGWFTDDDDGSRQITLIGLTSNDTLVVTASVTTSHEGRILNLVQHVVDGNSWDYTFTVQATEHYQAKITAEVTSEELGDLAYVKCRIEDNADVVNDDELTVNPRRMHAQADCAYIS